MPVEKVHVHLGSSRKEITAGNKKNPACLTRKQTGPFLSLTPRVLSAPPGLGPAPDRPGPSTREVVSSAEREGS